MAPTNPPAPAYTSTHEVFLRGGSLVALESQREVVLVDRSTLNGSVVTDFRLSPDGKKVLYSVAKNGSDSQFWSVYDLEAKNIIPDEPTRVRIYEVTWGLDSRGFFYSRWPDIKDEFRYVKTEFERTKGVDVAYHLLGSKAEQDSIVFWHHTDVAGHPTAPE